MHQYLVSAPHRIATLRSDRRVAVSRKRWNVVNSIDAQIARLQEDIAAGLWHQPSTAW